MSLKRTNVYADAEDLALIKDAAKRRGRTEAEILREGIHLAALSYRVWDEPVEWPKVSGGGKPATKDEIRQTVADRTAGK